MATIHRDVVVTAIASHIFDLQIVTVSSEEAKRIARRMLDRAITEAMTEQAATQQEPTKENV